MPKGSTYQLVTPAAGDSVLGIQDGETVRFDAGAVSAVSSTNTLGALAGLGDSITANGVSGLANLGTGVIGSVGARNWQMWASLLSGGRVRYAGVAATGGFTTQQIIDTHLPVVVSAIKSGRVSMVTVLCGTNDIGAGIPLSTITANLKFIYQAIADVGGRVIACMLTPRESAPGVPDTTSLRTALSRLNAWISIQQNVLVCDLHTPLVTAAGTWVLGLRGDNVHPNSAGAKVMGQVLADVLLSTTPVVSAPWLAATAESTASTGYSQIGNPLFTDTNGDGAPDGVSVPGGGTATTNTVGAGLRGNYFKFTATSASTAGTNIGNSVPASAGNQVLLTARIKSTVEPGGNADWLLLSKPSEATVFCGLVGWDRDVPDGSVLAITAVVPSLGAESAIGLQMKVRGVAGAGVELAQATVINTTTAGLTP